MTRSFKSVVHQVLGKQNVFGYSKATINRMHLKYWLIGEFYNSDVFDRKVRLLWGLFQMVSGLVMLGHCISYIIFTTKRDFTNILYTIQAILSIFFLLIIFPLVSYIYRKDTAEALKILDQINEIDAGLDKLPAISADIKFVQRRKYGSNILLKIFVIQVGMGTCFFICCNLHLFIGFTSDKLRQPDYYIYPTYCEQVESWTAFLILSLSQFVPSIPIIIMVLLLPWFSLGTTREFYHKFQSICDSIDYQSKLLSTYYQQLLANRYRSAKQIFKYQQIFTRKLYFYGKQHQDLLRTISHLKKYLQFSMSASVSMFLCNDVLLVSMFFMSGSIMTQIKALNMAAGICLLLYVNCLTGELFCDMTDMFNKSVYNMPWYYLTPSNRKSVYLLLLHRSQVSIKFKAVKVYLVDMTFFLRMCNYVYSFVNVLRRYYENTKYVS